MIRELQRENEDQHLASAARRPGAADLFRHAQPWRFASPNDGRKYRVVRERLRRLARCLAGKHFDRSGNCCDIYPAVDTILIRLRAAELNYPEGVLGPHRNHNPECRKKGCQRFTWSRRTVLVYLGRLEGSGIATANGLTHEHGTRRRVLNADKLLSVPLESCTPASVESCTPARHESCTRSKSPKKIHKDAASEKSSNRQRDDDFQASFSESQIEGNTAGKNPVDEAARLARLKAEAMAEIQIRTQESDDMVDAVLDLVLRRAADAGTIIRSRRYLVESFENHMAEAAAAPTAEVQSELYVGRGPEVGETDLASEAVGHDDVHETADVDDDAWTANLGRLEESGIAAAGQRARCPACDCSVLRWVLEDGLHRKVCPGRATSP
jgi:hypothetical protein